MAPRNLARLLPGVAALALAVLVAGPASANNRPALTVSSAVRGTSADVTVDTNRGKQQIATCTFVLDNATAADCGNPIDGGKKETGYDVGLSGLKGGSHTVSVTTVLTDGGGAGGSTSFTVSAGPRIFALAFSNLDGVAGYDPANDVLIAELVDNGDGVLGAGDTVVTGRYPLNFGATAFGTFTVTSHTVANVSTATPTQVTVTDSSNRQYSFEDSDAAHRYLEATSGTPTSEVSIFDSLELRDLLHVQVGAPSHPVTSIDPRILGGDATDGLFVDVTISVP
jgi:hypothetical protein